MTGCKNALVLLSGGLDSLACAEYYRQRGFAIHCLFVDYGQKAARPERQSARKIAQHMNVPLAELTVRGLSPDIGLVPGRNALLLALAIPAFPFCCGVISLGLHAGTPYLDSSPLFAETGRRILELYPESRVSLDLPFLSWSKHDIWCFLSNVQAPVHLTYSCEAGHPQTCGRCASCKDREALDAR